MKKVKIVRLAPDTAKKLGLKMRLIAYPPYRERQNMARIAKNALLLGATTEQVIKIWRKLWPLRTSGGSAVAQHRNDLRRDGYDPLVKKKSLAEIMGTAKRK
jgi:hypothetical protein